MARKLSKQERKEMARKAMEKRGNKKPSGSGFAKLDADAKSSVNSFCHDSDLKNAASLATLRFFHR